jgi:hypothetical protein
MPKHKKGQLPIVSLIKEVPQTQVGDTVLSLILGVALTVTAWGLVWASWICR